MLGSAARLGGPRPQAARERNHGLFVRVDGGRKIGLGHLTRCLALAQHWRARHGPVTFLTSCVDEALTSRIAAAGCRVREVPKSHPHPEDWVRTAAWLAEGPGAWVVLDGYHFDLDYQRRVRQAGHPLLLIDDNADRDGYDADVVLNQNIHAPLLTYPESPAHTMLLGTEFVLLRSEFLRHIGAERRTPATASKILVTLGGTDRRNHTMTVLRALEQTDAVFDIVVLAGASNPHVADLRASSSSGPHRVTVHVDTPDMARWMGWADIAVSAAGSTMWELLFMGTPSLVLTVSNNQREAAARLVAEGAAVTLGWHEELQLTSLAESVTDLSRDKERRVKLSVRGRRLVDGLGSGRVAAALAGKASD